MCPCFSSPFPLPRSFIRSPLRVFSPSSSPCPLLPHSFSPPAHLNPYHPLTVILQYSFLPFMSVSSHFAPGRQWIKSSDRQVLVLLLVLSETARCRAPVSVWCSLHQHAAARVQNRGGRRRKKRQTDTSSELIYSLLCQTAVFMDV